MMEGLRILEGEEEAATIAKVREIIATKPRVRDVAHWERGWSENCEAFKKSGDINALRPKYIRDNLPLRADGKFAIAEDPEFEWHWYKSFRNQIADKWMYDADGIWEFGCGSGHNIAWLMERYPKRPIVGLDWSASSVDICHMLGAGGHRFDFLHPTPFHGVTGMTVLTVGALEQVGRQWRPFLNYLLQFKPKRVIHVEPQISFYDPSSPVDATAIEAHKARGFWEGYLEAVQELERQGRLEIEHKERASLGSLLIEGYSLLIFRPL